MKLAKSDAQLLGRLRAVLDRHAGRYRELNGARDLGQYLDQDRNREDEELLTEPLLADLIEGLLGFPRDAYFPQLGRSGLKPDFTPTDLVAHRYVLDAKSSTQELGHHEPQIRAYIEQRQLDHGVLFNLRELRTYRRGKRGHEPELSFPLLPLWRMARGEAMPDEQALGPLKELVELFAYRAMGIDEKVHMIRVARSWTEREGRGETVEIDADFLVDRLRELSRELQEDAAAQQDALERTLRLQPARESALLRELELIALDLSPGLDLSDLPSAVAAYESGRSAGSGLGPVPAAGLPARPYAHPALPLVGGRRVRGELPLRRRLPAVVRQAGPGPSAGAARGVRARQGSLPLALRVGQQLRLVPGARRGAGRRALRARAGPAGKARCRRARRAVLDLCRRDRPRSPRPVLYAPGGGAIHARSGGLRRS